MTLHTLTVKRQLTLGFGLLIAAVVAISILALHALSTASAGFEHHVQEVAKREAIVVGVRDAMLRRAIAARNLVLVTQATDRETEHQAVLEAHKDTKDRLAALSDALGQSTDATDRDRELASSIVKLEAAYGPVALEIVRLALDGQKAEAIDKMNRECRPLLLALERATDAYSAYVLQRNAASVAAATTTNAHATWSLLLLSAAAVVAAVVVAWLLVRMLVGALGAEPAALGVAVRRVADGDLSPIAGSATAPANSVLASLGLMQGNLVHLIEQVREAAETISLASGEIAAGNNDLSNRTEQQASALQQTAASMGQLSGTVRQNADNARQANQLALQSSTVAAQGGEVVHEVVRTMQGINEASKRIADIIGTIDGIAFQTNILALNAAVEAARAGEQGRGFAVVASEVRSLAQRSADAAKEIKSLIDTSVSRVEQGTALVDKAGTTMTEVVTSIRRVTDIMGEISSASTEQSQGVAQVGEAVTQMDQATQQNAALVEQSAAAAESLKDQAQQLVKAVAVFKLVPALAR